MGALSSRTRAVRSLAPSRFAHGSLLIAAICVLALALGASPAAADLMPTAVFGGSVDQTTGANLCLSSSGDSCGSGTAGSGEGQFSNPTGVAVDRSTGDIYVADTANARIEKFDATGHFLMTWGWGVADGATAALQTCTSSCHAGIAGAGAGQFSTPVAIAVDNSTSSSAGDVYVADSSNRAVEQFSSGGAYISQLTGTPTGTAGASVGFSGPIGVALDPSGNVWLADSSNFVSEFDNAGNYISQYNDTYGQTQAIAVDSHENVYLIRGTGATEMWTPANRAGTGSQAVVDSGNATSLAIDPATDNLYIGEINSITEYANGAQIASFGSFGSTPGVAYNAAITVPGGGGPGALYVMDSVNRDGQIYAPAPLVAPSVDAESAVSVGATSAVIRSLINPHFYGTTYFVQYGTDTSYLSGSVPAPPGNALPRSNGSDQPGVTFLGTLRASTTYHYRVVAINQAGPSYGPDHTLTTYPTLGQFALADGRQYELVSSLDKFYGDILPDGSSFGPFLDQSSVDGNSVDYESWTSFGNAQSAPIVSNYIAARTPVGWTTQAVAPPRGTQASITADYQAFSPDLSIGILQSTDPPLAPGVPAHFDDLYLRDNAHNTYTAMNKVTPPNSPPALEQQGGFAVTFAGASTDYSHVVYEANDALTPNAPFPAAGNGNDVYEWINGQLQLVSVLPSGLPSQNAVVGNGFASNFIHAVSNDGSKVFFTDIASTNQLYVRENGAVTFDVSASQKTNGSGPGGTDPHGAQPASFMAASADGSKVFFTSSSELTNDANTGSSDGGNDLYQYDLQSGQLSDLTVDNNPADANGAQVQGVVGSSDDGSYLYYVAAGTLAAGASTSVYNLYLRHAGASTFIAPLVSGDSPDWSASLTNRNSEVTPDGRHVALMSSLPLTGYVNVDANTNQIDSEVFEYSADTNHLSCASCKPTNGQPIGPSSIPTYITAVLNPRYLSDDGKRLFFNSNDSLAPGDFNRKQDVFEYGNGQIHQISTGSSPSDSFFVDASASGNDVFFTTRQVLAQNDLDTSSDIYDARVGGGFPLVIPKTPCTGDDCRPLPPQAPVFGPPMSLTFVGGANLPDPPPAATTRKATPKKKAKPKPKARRAKQAKKSKARGTKKPKAHGKHPKQKSNAAKRPKAAKAHANTKHSTSSRVQPSVSSQAHR
ncbi:MAG TPA: hypothetical protein VLJ42_02345 [Solirubrobacteraceae bacterium]|nr:hypothetical protein [Solirubrobacteraceae bacterium]